MNALNIYYVYISPQFITLKHLKCSYMFRSGSTYCSLLKLHVKIVNMSLYLSVMWQHIVCLCICCFQCREVCRLARSNLHTTALATLVWDGLVEWG